MPLVECPRCHHKVASIASQCPSCAFSFSEDRRKHSRDSGPACRKCHQRLAPGMVSCPYCGVLSPRLSVNRWLTPALLGVVLVPLVIVGLRQRARALAKPAEASVPVVVSSAAAALDSIDRPVAAPIMTTPAAVPEAPIKWTSTWVNIRAGRGTDAEVIEILRPGEPVGVSDLRNGWWVVYLDGDRAGYVARDLLSDEPPGPEDY